MLARRVLRRAVSGAIAFALAWPLVLLEILRSVFGSGDAPIVGIVPEEPEPPRWRTELAGRPRARELEASSLTPLRPPAADAPPAPAGR
jgi:hypothetical protein